MIVEITVDDAFMSHKEWALGSYNAGKRTPKQHSMHIDCELYEHYLMKSAPNESYDGWEVDYVSVDNRRVDVKCLYDKWFNITPHGITKILHQRNFVDDYEFIEWVKAPDKPLQLGDTVEVRQLGILSYDDLAKVIRPSGFQYRGTSHYADVRKALK